VVERRIRLLTGVIAMVLSLALITFGVKAANGALRPRYHLMASFTSAGQGLISGSDVKIHGVNIGKVKRVQLVEGRALVRLELEKREKVPVDATATIRPKTLFGEKFVDIDPGPAESTGPFLTDEQSVRHTVGGFELEKVLTDLYPILKAVRPSELATVVGELAEGGRGMGPAINRQIAAFAEVTDVQAAHSADTRQFLTDLADLSEMLADRADELVGAAGDLNEVLPTVNANGARLGALLDQAARLSGDVADILEANKPFLTKAITEGGKTLQVLSDQRTQIAPLIVGLRQYVQVLGSVGRIPYGDGTLLAAVKFVAGEDFPCGRVPEGCAGGLGGAPTGTPAPASAVEAPVTFPVPSHDGRAVEDLIRGLLG
jgi:phospholipid/cholesterol/gamma-HCH transport system substrate-binding protein